MEAKDPPPAGRGGGGGGGRGGGGTAVKPVAAGSATIVECESKRSTVSSQQ